jgi:peroxiredoxin
MKRIWHCGLLLLLGVAFVSAAAGFGEKAKSRRETALGRRIANFVLPDVVGKQIGMADFVEKRALVVVFLGTECPIGNAYIPVLKDLRREYADKGVEFLAVNAIPSDSAEAVAAHAKKYEIDFPLLVDGEQAAVQQFDAERMTEVFVLDERRVVRYHGRIDDRVGYDYRRDEPRRKDLAIALDEVLAGKPVSVAETETAGCLITRRGRQQKAEVTYADVAPILKQHCVDCHHPGTAAPFSLLRYEDAANWSEMIGEVVQQRRMPPWHADPRFGHFENERRLPQKDIDTLSAWVAAGAPRGSVGDAITGVDVSEGWRIKPDVVFEIPEEFKVPASGTISYKYFRTPTNFTEDTWLQAAECRPGNRAVVHHIIVFYRDPKTKKREWIAATAPGAEPVVFPAGLGRKIPAGAELIWQVHYTANGKDEVDRSQVGFVFCKERPKYNVKTHDISNPLFQIPAGDANFKVQSFVPVQKNAVVLSYFPHMHVRGKSFEYEAVYPDGRQEKLLSVPHYDFNWQNTYRLKEPLHFPKGTMIRCTAHYDNSSANPANPDPAKTVKWGDQTWEEMMIGYVDYYYEDEAVNDAN